MPEIGSSVQLNELCEGDHFQTPRGSIVRLERIDGDTLTFSWWADLVNAQGNRFVGERNAPPEYRSYDAMASCMTKVPHLYLGRALAATPRYD